MSGSFKKAGTGTGVLKATLSVKPPKIGVPVRAKLPGNKTGTLQFTRTQLVPPYTKTNIAGAVATAVNFLDYTPVAGDAAYNIGVDATTTAATPGGAAVSPTVSTVPATMAAPVLTAGVGLVTVAFTAPSDGGSAILDYDYLDSVGNHTTLTGSGQTATEASGTATTGQIRARNAVGYGGYSPQSNSVTPTVPSVPIPTVTSVPVINGSPVVGTPLSITGAVFAGTVVSTAREVWRVNADTTLTQVFAGTTAQSYTPVDADASATGLYVRESATNSGGTVTSRSTTTTIAAAPSAAVVATPPTITGVPTVGVPLSITAGTFTGGNPAPTLSRVIYAGGTQVATSAGYTPASVDVGKIFTVDDVATNSSGAVHNMSANSAVCVANDPAADALFARMTVQPSASRKSAINTMITSLKSAGVWDALDAFYVMAAHTEQAGQLNWISNSFNLTPVAAPVFGNDIGYKMDGLTQWANTGVNPSLGTTKFSQNSATFGVYVLEATGGTNVAGLFNGTSGTQIVTRSTASRMTYRINQAASVSPTTTIARANGAGLYALNRTDAANTQVYLNGGAFAAGTPASVAPINGTFGFGNLGSVGGFFSGMTFQFGFIGSSLTAAQHTALQAAIEAYRATITVYPVMANFATTAQTYKGGYIELQADSFNGGSTTPATDGTTDLWGFPYSLTAAEQTRLRNLVMPGGGKGLMYIRFPLGFGYRGFRNIDSTTGLAKNIGERFAGQNAAISALLTNVIASGGGLQPEYWAPAPYWLVNSSYSGSDAAPNTLWAGGTYARTVTLDSIRTSDPTQYNAQIAAFTDAVINDYEYLHANIGPVRMYQLQNEPETSNAAYGVCGYSDTLTSDVLTVLEPKVRASAALSTYGGVANTPLLNVNAGTAYWAANPSRIFGYTYHTLTAIYADADYVKASATAGKAGRANLWINECEYFVTTAGAQYQCANNMLRGCHDLAYGNAPVNMPIIHLLKQLGQTTATSSTNGYGLLKTRLPAPYGQAPGTSGDPDSTIGYGEFAPVSENYNSFLFLSDNVPVGSVRVGGLPALAGETAFAAFTSNGKLSCLMVNRTTRALTFSIPLPSSKTFAGKRYDYQTAGSAIGSQTGATLTLTIPAMSGEAWVEQ